MKTYRYIVVVQTEVEAFTEDDAKDSLLDTFGIGDFGNIEITDVTIKEAK